MILAASTANWSLRVFPASLAGMARTALLTILAVLAVAALGAAAWRDAEPGGSRALAAGSGPAPLRTLHVDYARGNDAAAGTSRALAWKHAPGDPQATGRPRTFIPRAGDRILFAAGTRYTGAIAAPWQGTAQHPIVIEGAGSGHTAIIDGSSQSALPRPCASQNECAGLASWRQLAVARFASPLAPDAALAQGGVLLADAQWPDPADPFYADATPQFVAAEGSALNEGNAPLPPEIEALLTDPAGLRIAIWTLHNSITERPVATVAGGLARFDPAGARTYTDRPSRFALRGHPALISRAGEAALLPDRRTVILRPGASGGAIFASDGRSGIDLAEARHVVVRGLGFENFADVRGNVRSGIPVLAMRKGAADVRIIGNRFANITLRQGMGAITLWDSSNVAIRDNLVSTVAFGSGLRLLRGTRLQVLGNDISRLGRTGIMVMDSADTLIARNRIHDIRGVHGNGLSVYLGNRRTVVAANSIWDANSPVTFQGNAARQPVAEDMIFARNLLVAPDDALGTLISWGKQARGVRITGNVILGSAKGALRLNRDDLAITVEGNVLDGIAFAGAWPQGWSVAGNSYRKLGALQARHQPGDRATFPFSATGPGARPSALAGFCPALAHDASLVAPEYSMAIGADFTCPAGPG